LKAVDSAHAIRGATILLDPAGKLKATRFKTSRGKHLLQVLVRDNNVDQALRVLKKKMQREGVFREMKRRRFYEKPSEKTAREKGEAIRRARKLARKRAQREGLIAAPRKKEPAVGKTGGPYRSPTNR
jgi:small subunit ribosomal protein S21